MKRGPLQFFRIALILLACLSPLVAQQAGLTLKVDVSLIPLDVAVYDGQDQPVKTLAREDFLVYENGVLQDIQHFEAVDAPYTILLLFDTSGSTKNQLGFMMDAANRFLGNLRLDDQVALASFSVGVTRLLDWRTRRGPSQQIGIPPGSGGTDLYGALAWSAAELGRRDGRKGVLVMTDGLDGTLGSPNEKPGFQLARDAVERSRSPFYFVMVPDGTPGPSVPFARQRMSELADRSGGRVLFPKTLSDVAPLYERIAKDLGASYSLAYGATGPRDDGTYRHIEVKVKQPGLRVSQSRTGYYAWAAGSAAPQQTLAPPPLPAPLPRPQPGQVPAPLPQPQSVQVPTPPQQAPPPAAVLPSLDPVSDGSPVLVTPIALALLPPPEKESWRFLWTPVPRAARYQIVVNAPGVASPIIEAESRSPQYVSPARRIASPGRNARGWSWKVRAQINGVWGSWSESRMFDVFVNEP